MCQILKNNNMIFYNVKNPIKLTHFEQMFHFYTSWKGKKNLGFLMFSGGMEMEHWLTSGLALFN